MPYRHQFVPPEGPLNAAIALVGAYPGMEELKRGRPFVGKAGRELDGYLERHGLRRDQLYITNLIKTPVGDVDEDELDPDSVMVRDARAELLKELRTVQPGLIMTLGSLPTRVMGIDEPLEACHGLLHEGAAHWLLPAYNPAAGIRRTDLMLRIERDFEALNAGNRIIMEPDAFVFDSDSELRLLPKDQSPNPFYCHLSDPGMAHYVLDQCYSTDPRPGAIFIDTEGSVAEPWSLQFTMAPGEGYLILAADTVAVGVFAEWMHHRRRNGMRVVLHNALHDIAVLRAMGITIEGVMEDQGFIDTMVMAYHLCDEPQGLKALAYRHCGMKMREYAELVQPAQNRLAQTYLEAVYQTAWPAVQPETVWRNGKQAQTKPWQIKRHAENILANYHGMKVKELRDTPQWGEPGNDAVDMAKRWGNVDEAKRAVVEQSMGPMPEAGLEHIDFDDALNYACRDADALCRVYGKLKVKYEEVLGATT